MQARPPILHRPGAPIGQGPLKDVKMAVFCSPLECPAIPWAVVASQEAQRIQVAILGSTCTGILGQGQLVFHHPLQHGKRARLG